MRMLSLFDTFEEENRTNQKKKELPDFILNDLNEFKIRLNKDKPLYIDTETEGLYTKIRLIQLYQEGMEKVFIFETKKIPLLDIYEIIRDCYVLTYNYAYDAVVISNELNLKANPFKSFDCLLLLARVVLAYDLWDFSLDRVLTFILGKNPYSEAGIIKKVMQRSYHSKTLDREQLAYGAIDVLYLNELFLKCKDFLNDYTYKLDKSFLDNALSWQNNGLPVLKDVLNDYKKDLELDIHDNLENLPHLNVNSSKQVSAYLKTSNSEELTLKTLHRQGNKDAGLILKIRKDLKRLNTLKKYDFDVIKGFYSTLTKSGRVTCAGTDIEDNTSNLMQIPRDLSFIIGYKNSNNPDDFKYLIHADYSQLELRSITALVGEEVMYNTFKNGDDLHIKTASFIFNKEPNEVTKSERYLGKVCNFSLLYGAGANTFKNIITTDAGDDFVIPNDEELYHIINKWKQYYKSIDTWHKEALKALELRHFENQTINGKKFITDKFNNYLSYQNQGLGAEIAKLALHYFTKLNGNGNVINFVHDAYYLRAKTLQEAEMLANSICECMVMAFFNSIQRAKIKDVPMPVSAEIGNTLKETEEKPLKIVDIAGTYDFYLKNLNDFKNKINK